MRVATEQLGSIVEMLTLAGDTVAAQYAVVDVSELVASNHLNGAINEAFPQELQPRNRTTAEAVYKLSQQSLNIDFSRLNASKKTDIGAPIAGEDLIVESGNGRVMALTKAYAEGHAYEYRYQLCNSASRFGLSQAIVESINRPVLIRVRLSPVNRAQFAKDCNLDTEASQSEKLADNGRLFESVTQEQMQRLTYKGKSLLNNIEFAHDKGVLIVYLMESIGKTILSNDPSSDTWLKLAAINITARMKEGRLNTNAWTNFSVHYSIDGTDFTNSKHIGLEPDFWNSPIIEKALGDGLGVPPIEADVFHGYVYALSSINRATLKLIASSPDPRPLAAREVAQHLQPLAMLAGHDLTLVSKLLYAICGLTITPEQVDSLLNAPDIETDFRKASPELFTESAQAMIDDCYKDLVTSLTESQRKEALVLLEEALDKKYPSFTTRYQDSSSSDNMIRGAIWDKFSHLVTDAYAALGKKPSDKKARQIYDDYVKNMQLATPEAMKVKKAFELYQTSGAMPSANVVSIDVLSMLIGADVSVKSQVSSQAIEKVTRILDGYKADNVLLSRLVPPHDAGKMKGQIKRYNKKDANTKKINELSSVLDDCDEFNRLTAGAVPADLGLCYEKFRAHYSHTGGAGGTPLINIGSGSKGTMWHELGHALEYQYPALANAAKALLISRAVAAKPPMFVSLNDYESYPIYGDDEYAVNNFTFSLYAMKVYSSASRAASAKLESLDFLIASEVISTAFELLSSESGIARLMSDKEHFSIAMAAVKYLQERT